MMVFRSAFVTGSTGLLGNNLVRALVGEGVAVKGLARSRRKSDQQFGGLPNLKIVEGDLLRTPDFAAELEGADVLFHTAAYFRDSYGGGRHWPALHATNVEGTRNLLDAALVAGIKRVVLTSSIAVLTGGKGDLVNETMLRREEDADDYYRSKILTERVAFDAMDAHPDLDIRFVLPGWMHGPGDAGPTSAGQFTLDFINRRLPGIPPATFSIVDARDVAAAHILAAKKGKRAERYLAAGRHMSMADLMKTYETVSGIRGPKRQIPGLALRAIAEIGEFSAAITGKPTLISRAAVQSMLSEADRTRFDPEKSRRELGLTFRPVEETLRDEIAWFQATHQFV